MLDGDGKIIDRLSPMQRQLKLSLVIEQGTALASFEESCMNVLVTVSETLSDGQGHTNMSNSSSNIT